MLADLRFAFRDLLRNPGFSAAAVATVMLGIAGTTSVFSMVNTIILRPLPFQQEDELIYLRGAAPERGEDSLPISYPTLLDWSQQARVFESMAGYYAAFLYMAEGDRAQRIPGAWVTPELFTTLGVEALDGRVFGSAEGSPAAAPVVLVGYALWQNHFGGDPALIGRTLRISGQTRTVVGIMPPEFRFPEYAHLWLPFVGTGTEPRGEGLLSVVARLRQGATLQQARTEMREIARRLAGAYPEDGVAAGVRLLPLRRYYVGDTWTAALVFQVVALFVLLIVCANLANLLLVRASARDKEMAVRAALGGGRGRLIRQLLTENVLLAALGGLPGLFLGLWGLHLLIDSIPIDLPFWAEFGFDYRVLIFVVVVSVLTGVAFGLVPALRFSRPDLVEALKVGGRSGPAGGKQLTMKGLVVAQVAVSLALLVAGGLMARGFLDLQRVEPGYHPDGVLTAVAALAPDRYEDPEKQRRFARRLLRKLGNLAEVETVAVASRLPVYDSPTRPLSIEGSAPLDAGGEKAWVMVETVSRAYFETLGIPVLEGRAWNDDDEEPLRAVVNQKLARRFWPDGEAVGSRLKLASWNEDGLWIDVIGVVGDVRQSLDRAPASMVFLPLAYGPTRSLTVFLRAPKGASAALSGQVRNAVRELDPEVPVERIKPLREVVDESIWQPSIYAWLLAVFAGFALVLAVLGLYGVIAYAVSHRSREVGIRMALGARRRDVLLLFLRQAFVMVTLGIVLGLAVAVGLSGALASMLPGFAAADVPLIVALVACFLAVAALATLVPAGRAASIDPADTLRAE